MTTTEQLAAALRDLLADRYLADPINADRMAPAREALARYDAEQCRHLSVDLALDRAGGTASCTDCGATEARA